MQFEHIHAILTGIDKTETESTNGWWQSSEGAEFGKTKLTQIKKAIELAATPYKKVTLPELQVEYLELNKAINENIRAQKEIIATEFLNNLGLKISDKITFSHNNILSVINSVCFIYGLEPVLFVNRIKKNGDLSEAHRIWESDLETIKKVN